MRNSFIKHLFGFLLIPIAISAQNLNADSAKIQHVLDFLSIKFNRPDTPEGFRLYYNCDSMAFFKKIHGDTITILTQASMTPMSFESDYEFNSFTYYISHRRSYPPSFPQKYMDDGRIEIVDYGPTIFIFRNDSLFIRESNDDKFLEKMFKIIDKHTKGKIDSAKMTREISIVREKYKPVWTTRYIFNKKMFATLLTVDIDPSLNPQKEKVTLERKWIKNGVNCYLILIEGKYKDTKTAVRYTFDDNINFISWEGCEK